MKQDKAVTKSMKRYNADIKSLFVVLAMAFTFVACHDTIKDPSDAPKAALQAALDALFVNDIDGFLENVDFGEELDSMQMASFKSVLQQHIDMEQKQHDGVKSIDIVDAVMKSDTICTVYYQYNYCDSIHEVASQKMVRTDGIWKLRVRN